MLLFLGPLLGKDIYIHRLAFCHFLLPVKRVCSWTKALVLRKWQMDVIHIPIIKYEFFCPSIMLPVPVTERHFPITYI